MNIERVLEKIAQLLRQSMHNDWANALEKFHSEIEASESITIANILAMYGGMGSLNDLVLYKDGQPLAPENTEFDALRSQLYLLCREYHERQ